MRIAAISDLHGELIPWREDVDLHLIAGDVCPLRESHDPFRQTSFISQKLEPWLASCPTEVVWIGGNHDFVCERFGQKQINAWAPSGVYLAHDFTYMAELKIWGMPYVLNLEGWAFNLREGQMQAAIEMIPDDIDILLAHNPPRGMLDTPLSIKRHETPHVGSTPLARRIFENPGKLKVVVCGHIHEGRGSAKANGVNVYNVAHLTRDYDPYYTTELAWTIFSVWS